MIKRNLFAGNERFRGDPWFERGVWGELRWLGDFVVVIVFFVTGIVALVSLFYLSFWGGELRWLGFWVFFYCLLFLILLHLFSCSFYHFEGSSSAVAGILLLPILILLFVARLILLQLFYCSLCYYCCYDFLVLLSLLRSDVGIKI